MTALSTDTIQPQPDGIHLRVVNEYDEPVSIAGFDADMGATSWIFTQGPGTMELMCWPFSQHGSGEPPPRVPLEIVDPVGLYVDGSLLCEIEMQEVVDGPLQRVVDEGPPSLHVARRVIAGLRADDGLRIAGYPEQEGGSVLVIRQGAIVGRYWIERLRGQPWEVTSGSACEGSGLLFEGRSYG